MEFLVKWSGKILEVTGVLVITLGALVAVISIIRFSGLTPINSFQIFRRRLGQSILLGLEFLVAGDIIRTVAVLPSFSSVGILSAIVLIRTFLSFTLEVEMTGKWPWQQGTKET